MGRILRKTIFWLHLIVGVIAGIVIAIMCFTGVALAFEKEIVLWADRDLRKISAPAGGAALPVSEILAKAAEAQPSLKQASMTISTDPNIAVLVNAGRTNAVYVNQYTGGVSAPASPRLRAFLNTMIEWHRYIAQHGDDRTRGKMITGACNVGFLFLAVSGIYLWWPRSWTGTALRNVITFKRGLSGKARDWNWHNVIGFWTAPVLIVLTATAMPISYKWAGDAIYKMTGTPPPAPNSAPTPSTNNVIAARPGTDLKTVSGIIAAVRNEVPTASQITMRSAGKGPLTLTVKDQTPRPRFANVQLTFDAQSGGLVKKETYADFNAGRKVRSWTRFLHTGEALGPAGQTIAGLASFGGLILVWTGFALAIRRFLGRKGTTTAV